jgi:hypothetical protein
MRPDTFLRDDGQRGAVVDRINGPDGTPLAVIEFPDGMRFEVPESLLPDAPGEDAPALSRKVVEAGGGRIIIPVIAEQLSVEKRSVPRTIVRVHKRVESRDEVIEEPLLKQTVTVERIPINQLVEGEPPAPRMLRTPGRRPTPTCRTFPARAGRPRRRGRRLRHAARPCGSDGGSDGGRTMSLIAKMQECRAAARSRRGQSG